MLAIDWTNHLPRYMQTHQFSTVEQLFGLKIKEPHTIVDRDLEPPDDSHCEEKNRDAERYVDSKNEIAAMVPRCDCPKRRKVAGFSLRHNDRMCDGETFEKTTKFLQEYSNEPLRYLIGS